MPRAPVNRNKNPDVFAVPLIAYPHNPLSFNLLLSFRPPVCSLAAMSDLVDHLADNLSNDDLEQLDVSDVPDEITCADSPTQAQVVEGIIRNTASIRATDDAEFYEKSVKDLPVRTLKKIYDTRNRDHAIRMLHRRHRITFGRDDLYDPKDPALGWGRHKHFLDFLLVVPKEPGLDAIIPNREVDHNFSFDFTLTQYYRPWTTKYGELGFDPSRRMLYIGKAGGQNVWLAMAPADVFGEETSNLPYRHDNYGSSGMVMPRPRYRRVVEMLSYMMKGMFDVHMLDSFTEHIDSEGGDAWQAHTSIL